MDYDGYTIRKLHGFNIPEDIRRLSDAPGRLFMLAEAADTLDDLLRRPRVAIVGTRNVTPYGQAVTTRLASELAGSGVVIVSGLALGVDAIAHQAALEAGGLTLAVLPTAIDQIHPRRHRGLAERIVAGGGALLSEYSHGAVAYKTNFVARNRLVTAASNALLMTEAAVGSGTMHTATFAFEQGKDVMVVPGNITSPASAGTNNLLKSAAHPVTSTRDVLQVLGLPTERSGKRQQRNAVGGGNMYEKQLIDLMHQGVSDGHELLARSGLSVEQYGHHMTMLEITARIRALGANHWCLV